MTAHLLVSRIRKERVVVGNRHAVRVKPGDRQEHVDNTDDLIHAVRTAIAQGEEATVYLCRGFGYLEHIGPALTSIATQCAPYGVKVVDEYGKDLPAYRDRRKPLPEQAFVIGCPVVDPDPED